MVDQRSVFSPAKMDILLDILKEMMRRHPASGFVKSLHDQYCNRGGLSKKQLEGLLSKAAKANSVSQSKLATLEAIIKKKPTREKAAASIRVSLPVKDEATRMIIAKILERYPQHKRLLFLRSKYENNEHISPAEQEEIKKFSKLLLK